MRCRFAHRLAVAGAVLALAGWAQAKPPLQLGAGEYAVTVDNRGVSLVHGGTPISLGNYFTIFRPEYKGTLVAWTDCWEGGALTAAPDGRSATLEVTKPEAKATYGVAVSERGLRLTVSVALAATAAVGPVEYPVVQFPSELAAGATVDLLNVAGMVVESLPVAATPTRGHFGTQHGDVLVLRTPQRKVTVSCESAVGLAPFDARVPQYGQRQGIWAFSTIPVGAGTESAVTMEIAVAPPDPTREPGQIRIAPGVAATAVVTAPTPTAREKLAADELAAYLEQMTGRRLERRELAGTDVPPGAIAVGTLARTAGLVNAAELETLRRDGYLVRVAAGRAAVCGRRDVGTAIGAYAFLHHLGVRFYAPGCEVVPATRELTIPACELRQDPAYDLRVMRGNLKLGHTPKDDLMAPSEIGAKGNIVHASEFLVPYEEYGESHPEYFALQKDGKRLHGDPTAPGFNVHLCLSNPDVRRISAERMLMLVGKQSDRTFFGVSQGDGFAWCECDACKALDAEPGKVMTDRLLDYVNYVARAVAAQYPDKIIVTLAYTNATSPPPTRVMPEKNVMVQYCPYPQRTACQSHDLTCERNRQGFADLTGWLAKCPQNMYIFDYPCGYAVYQEPFGSFYAMKRKLDFYAAHGIRGLYYCGVPTTFRDLFVFVQSRLLWEPTAPVEPLIDEFMAAYYGPAAPVMRRYFDVFHREVESRPVHQMCEGPNPGLITPALAEQALKLFAEAEAAVASNRPALYRVRQEKFIVLFADLNERNPPNGRLVVPPAEFARRLAEFVRIGRDLKVGNLLRRQKSASEWLYQTTRLRTQRQPWYADPLVSRLIADPVATLALAAEQAAQQPVDGGLQLLLDGFTGCRGPEEYAHQCPPRSAIWIYGKNTPTAEMKAVFRLDAIPAAPARLVLTGQDDDKPGSVGIRVCVNGTEIFSGPNGLAERGWSSRELAIPAGVLKAGMNELRIAALNDSPAPDAGWFMLAECRVLWP